jgi:hypothetical protein
MGSQAGICTLLFLYSKLGLVEYMSFRAAVQHDKDAMPLYKTAPTDTFPSSILPSLSQIQKRAIEIKCLLSKRVSNSNPAGLMSLPRALTKVSRPNACL